MVKSIYGVDLQDDPSVHPPRICMSCNRTLLLIQQHDATISRMLKGDALSWTPHGEACTACDLSEVVSPSFVNHAATLTKYDRFLYLRQQLDVLR